MPGPQSPRSATQASAAKLTPHSKRVRSSTRQRVGAGSFAPPIAAQAWSIRGAEWSQSVANRAPVRTAQSGENRCRGVATACREADMVRRGSRRFEFARGLCKIPAKPTFPVGSILHDLQHAADTEPIMELRDSCRHSSLPHARGALGFVGVRSPVTSAAPATAPRDFRSFSATRQCRRGEIASWGCM
jgi:hypothetical protein